MRLSNFKVHQLEPNNVLHNEPSNTIKDEKEYKNWENQRVRVVKHYVKKWDGEPDHEKFNSPFNK
jgi:hypothetical protein